MWEKLSNKIKWKMKCGNSIILDGNAYTLDRYDNIALF